MAGGRRGGRGDRPPNCAERAYEVIHRVIPGRGDQAPEGSETGHLSPPETAGLKAGTNFLNHRQRHHQDPEELNAQPSQRPDPHELSGAALPSSRTGIVEA